MSVKATWGHQSAHGPAVLEDPFADDAPPVRVTQVGVPVDIDADRPTLDRKLVDLLDAESDLFNAQITCAIKDTAHTSCFACPLYEGDGTAARAPLCRLGREQQRVLTLLAVLKNGE